MALGLVTAVVVLPASPAQAQQYCGVTAECAHYFFSEPAKIHLVGEYIILCGGAIYQWGTQTPYQIHQDTLC